ncbi:MAG: hypothetical protein QM813_06050 [Verrucomicrobiota bacterium]
MRAEAILLSKIIYATATVSDSQLVALGLLPRSRWCPVPAPSTAPTVEVGIVAGRLVHVRLHPSDSTRRGIEAGSVGANLYSFVGAVPPVDPRLPLRGNDHPIPRENPLPQQRGRRRDRVAQRPLGQRRGQSGPASGAVSFTLQAARPCPKRRRRKKARDGQPQVASHKQRGQSCGAESVTLGLEQIPFHQHGYTQASGVNPVTGEASPGMGASVMVGATLDSTPALTDQAGGTEPHENMPPFGVVRWIVKS